MLKVVLGPPKLKNVLNFDITVPRGSAIREVVGYLQYWMEKYENMILSVLPACPNDPINDPSCASQRANLQDAVPGIWGAFHVQPSFSKELSMPLNTTVPVLQKGDRFRCFSKIALLSEVLLTKARNCASPKE